MGQNPSDEEVFQMLNEVDDDGSGGIEFPEFLKVIDSQKAKLASDHDESDMIDAFVAMGGCADRSGNIEAEKLRRTIKAIELTIDIERLIKEVLFDMSVILNSIFTFFQTDLDGSGYIDYEEFRGELFAIICSLML
jgi:calmodulin